MKALLSLLTALACFAAAATPADAKTKARAKPAPRTVLSAFTYGDHAALLYEIPAATTYSDGVTILPGRRIQFECESAPSRATLDDAAYHWLDTYSVAGPLTTKSQVSVSGHEGAYYSSMGVYGELGSGVDGAVQLKALALRGDQNRDIVCGAIVSLKATNAQRAALDRVFKSFVLRTPYPAP